MRQIGARQEASRLGGIGSCGRELCCSTWLTDFRTVTTSAARYQQLSLNPLKLAGQCGKLKCCLNYELDSYLDALKEFPEGNPKLLTTKGNAFHQKTDIFRRMMWYSYEADPSKFIALTVDKVKEIVALNKEGNMPAELVDEFALKAEAEIKAAPDYENVVGQDSLTRFDRAKSRGGKNKGRNQRKEGRGKSEEGKKTTDNRQQTRQEGRGKSEEGKRKQRQGKPNNQRRNRGRGPRPNQNPPKP
jgi:hypothetical protein